MTSPGGPEDRLEAHARAQAVFEAWTERRDRGEAESEDELLAAHAELSEWLCAMLEGERHATRTEAMDGAAPSPVTWRGLPGEHEDFGPYTIVSVLGQGGMGAVFLARHRELGRKVALKLIRPERLFADRARERFWREAVAVSRLEHPNICPVYDVGEVEGIPYMTMRFVEGLTLAKLIGMARDVGGASSHVTLLATEDPSTGSGESEATAQSLSALTSAASTPTTRKEVFAVVRVFEDIARGLHHAHEQGIVHRDIKPGNIMVDGEGRPVLLDFGLARDEAADDQSLTMTGDLAGTPLYMSPEQVNPRGRELTRATDIYSLGATLYECLTLQQMVTGTSTKELFDSILHREPVPAGRINPSVPRDLEVVIEKAVDKDPLRRYATALDLAEDLRRVRSYEPVHARRAGAMLRARRWVQRYPWVASFAGLLVVALVVSIYLLVAAEQARAEFRLVEGQSLLRRAIEQEKELYANWPKHAPALQGWLHTYGEPLRQRPPVLMRTLADLRSRGRSVIEPGRDERWVFDDPMDRFLHDTTVQLTRDLDVFFGPKGRFEHVQRLLDYAPIEHEQTIAAHREAWHSAIAAIEVHPRYGGLKLTPQLGLVPLRENPQSGLWEFVHLASGSIPERDEETGTLHLTGETGLVFVLIPPGEFYMGSQPDDTKPSYDPNARADEQPVRRVPLAAYFLSKYQMSGGQWRALTGGELPGSFRAGKKTRKLGVPFTLVHPVESVSWDRCCEVLGWYGLDVPTEAQWEYACRAGTDTPWWTGRARESLLDPDTKAARVNLADQSILREGASFKQIEDWPELDDGFAFTAPVDAFGPNPFGLYQMHGNLFEWCRDWYDRYDLPVAEGDGLRQATNQETHVARGGCWDYSAYYARAAYRRQAADPAGNLGVRPFRRIVE